jgi:hypothetical protein
LSVGLNPAQVGVVGQRADDCLAHPRPVARQVRGQDPGRFVERGVLEQRKQPALGELVQTSQ